jgi:hypothetical protein
VVRVKQNKNNFLSFFGESNALSCYCYSNRLHFLLPSGGVTLPHLVLVFIVDITFRKISHEFED